MRELKFRAWDRKTNKMYGVWKWLYIDLPQEQFELSGVDGIRRCDSLDLMQYTGLKDKNGVEIYEGDIVEWTIWPEDFNRAAPIEKRIRDVVAFSKSGSWVAEERHEILGLKEPHRGLEVIGNIYENPELLTNQKESKEG